MSYNIYRIPFLIFIYLCCLPFSWSQDCDAKTLEEFYECYGGQEAFGAHSVDALTTFIQAEDAIQAGDYTLAKNLIDNLFSTYPKGNNVWWNAYSNINGSNIASPHAYNGLRMIEDIVDHHLNNNQEVEAKKAYMKVVLVGCSKGIQPTNETELQNGTGEYVVNTVDPNVQADDYRIVMQSFDFFSKYVTAITKGQLEIEVEVVELPNTCIDVNVTTTLPHVAYGSMDPVWNSLSDEVKESTDWWWIMYPSHVPEYPAFDDIAFITGGMGLDHKGGPAFLIDDKWIVRKPAHLGKGPYSDIERRAYLPQWFQHEFFHHLYRAYPELLLEVNGHDWFDLNFWPDDFEGRFETDYYSESLHKRLQLECIPMATKLITREDNETELPFDQVSMDELLGFYSIDAIQNDWHSGEIIKQGNQYYWKNTANVQWTVTPKLDEGMLETGADCPYPGTHFFVKFHKTPDGDYIPGVSALRFGTLDFKKRFDLIRESAPIEIALGNYTRMPQQSMLNSGDIIKESGLFYWEYEDDNRWLLTPNAEDEHFALNADSPTPDMKFELIIDEERCGIHAIGFKYLDDYYWKEKRDLLNESPTKVNPLSDLELDEDFGTYTIDLSDVFSDPEGGTLLLFASSSESDLLSTAINEQQLVLSGGDQASASIIITAIDDNGGVVTDEFTVQVGESVSSHDLEDIDQLISIFPNPTQDYITLTGALTQYDISIHGIDGTFQQNISTHGEESRFDLSNLSSSIYIIRFAHKTDGRLAFKKIIKY